MQNSQANSKRKSTKVFWKVGKINLRFPPCTSHQLWHPPRKIASHCPFWMGEACLLTVGASSLTVELLCLQSIEPWLRCFLDTLSHCKQKSSNCKQKFRTPGRTLWGDSGARKKNRRKNPPQKSTAIFKSEFGSFTAKIHTARIWPWLGITAACYRTEKAQIPKSAGGSAGKSARKKGTAGGTAGSSAAAPLFHTKQLLSALLPAVPPAVPFFLALFPALPPALLGIWAFSVLQQAAVIPSLGLRPERPFTGVSGPSGPEIPKKSQKEFLGCLQKSPRRYPKKSKNTQNWTFSGIFRLFRVPQL